ncbi:hypothetical protein A2933_01600 [Candidatus Nomurabacteria bacterium RIFCSPLOWO2_01_FULL_46_18]|uniref:DUF305 domain-containing protein n=1 Tax=Candidatus Nomurabacteria bacterium RIFCSPLOWO2_01_FULL_46_18 TaxID=1801783 RepID=A0A1F6XCE5_9BACT|nr:MAG: hypothetical protein A2933_01600 [Candidatus Nomurabacteria bacterium RIFCSPLOWO2_01_FULL_46_18]
MKKEISFGIGGVVIGLVLASIFTPTMFPGYRNGGSRMMGDNQNTENTQIMGNIDRHFIEQMIPHHEGAVAMAELALEKSKRPEIKTLANAIIVGQSSEIEDMTVWYKNWFGKDVPKGNTAMMGGGMMLGNGMHMGGQEDMNSLETATDFDKAFIEAMIPHHQLAIMMAQMLKSGTDRSEMLSLANNIIESQSKEIEEMQNWYQSWYK